MSDQTSRPTISRRAVVAATIAAATVPAHAAPPSGHPLPGVEFAFQAIVELAPSQTPGATPYGHRNRVPITGGSFEGPKIRGKVLPGGADWQLVRADGCVVVDADYMIQADDGALIHVHNVGVISGKPGTPDFYLRTSPVFEAPIGPHDWLNKSVFIGTVEGVPGREGKAVCVCVRVFRVT